jgi:hypothetical protein
MLMGGRRELFWTSEGDGLGCGEAGPGDLCCTVIVWAIPGRDSAPPFQMLGATGSVITELPPGRAEGPSGELAALVPAAGEKSEHRSTSFAGAVIAPVRMTF